jgi:hypothetical protein
MGCTEYSVGTITGKPAAAPLFSDERCCTGATGGIENKIVRIGGHQQAPLVSPVSAEHGAMKRQACRLHYLLDRIRPEDVA